MARSGTFGLSGLRAKPDEERPNRGSFRPGEPDPLWLASWCPSPVTPERRLLWAVLGAVVLDLSDLGGRFSESEGERKLIRARARAWVASDEQRADEEGWSFIALCAELELDAGTLRRALLGGEAFKRFEVSRAAPRYVARPRKWDRFAEKLEREIGTVEEEG